MRRGGAAMLGSLQRLVLVLSLILGSGKLVKAQGTPNRVAFVQSSPSQALASPLRHVLPLNSSVSLIQAQGNFHDGSGFRITENYQHQNPNSLFPFRETTTSFMAESRLPVAKVWGARLQVNFFAVTLHTGNVMLGPLISSDASQRARRFGQPRSTSLYGIGVRVPATGGCTDSTAPSLPRYVSRGHANSGSKPLRCRQDVGRYYRDRGKVLHALREGTARTGSQHSRNRRWTGRTRSEDARKGSNPAKEAKLD